MALSYKKIVLVVFLSFFALVLFSSWTKSTSPEFKAKISYGDTSIFTDVANTFESRRMGLSGRESLSKDTGLLFVFDFPTKPSFWMKDMNFPINIIWIKEDFVVLNTEEDVSPDTYPSVFTPEESVLYVLEVSADSNFTPKKGERLNIEMIY